MSAEGKFYIVCAPLCKMHKPVHMAMLFQTSLVFHLLLCKSIFKVAQGLTAVWAQLILKDSCGTCYKIVISIIIMIYDIGISKRNSFEDNQAHNVQCISTWWSLNFLFPITESLKTCGSMASLHHQHVSIRLWNMLMMLKKFWQKLCDFASCFIT